MKIVFMGTPEFAIPSLQAILDGPHEVVGVVTVPDKPTGRGLKIKSSPVKQLALDYDLPVFQPEQLNDARFIAELDDLQADLFVIVAFRILPKQVFLLPAKGAINLHASLLPRYRGAAPINWAIIRGESETGITIFFLKEKVDTGNIILQESIPILDDDNAGSLHDRLMNLGAEVLLEAIDLINEEKDEITAQHGKVTLAPKITREGCHINWADSAVAIHNLIRGLSPYPGAFCYYNNKLLKIYKTEIAAREITPSAEPGTFLELKSKTGLITVATGDGSLSLQKLQLAGKKCITSSEFLRGSRIKIGDKLS